MPFFTGLIKIIDTYRGDLLITKGISEEQFSMILSILPLIASITVTFSRKIQKKFKNKTLTFISLSYVMACIVIGIVANVLNNGIGLPIILLMYAVLKMCSATWYTVEYKYVKNFTTEEIRNKIMFIYELIGCIVASTLSLIGSAVLEKFNVERAFLLVGLGALVAIVLSLDYMRTRFGLRPKEYKKEDIEFYSK